MNNKDFAITEREIYANWEKKGYFKADPNSKKEHYSLLMPPPNLTGELHLGHGMQHAILDAIARFKRLNGFDVLLLPGVDHAGIQFESTLNKSLSKEGLTKEKLGREAWLKKAWEFKEKIYESFHSSWIVFGLSADWSREVFTLDENVQKAVVAEFKKFWEDDLIYKGAYIVQWCPKDQTAIEDLEMEYEEKKEKLYFVKYKIKDVPLDNIIIATARPETIFADKAIAVYPNHPKYKKFVGKMAQNPLNGEWIPIIEDKRVQKDFGTGALKITPGHDPLDYEIGKDQKPSLEIVQAVDKTGRMTAIAGELVGQKVQEGRSNTVDNLRTLGAIEKEEEYVHSVPVCERCKTVVEPLISEEWFVKMKPLAETAIKNISRIKFIPENYKEVIASWLSEIHDWSISRSLWWGHRIPVWYCRECNLSKEVGSDKSLIISLNAPIEKCKICGSTNWIQEEKVLDTWFSSGIWPLATLGWPNDSEDLNTYYPFSFEISAPEIKFLWIARMIMLGLYIKEEIPFENMFFHGMIRDLEGRKFSKSLGNGIDPNVLREQWGTDAVRMALYTYAAPGRDGKASKQTMDERCKNYRNFGTKLRNLHRFIFELKQENPKKEIGILTKEDKQIITKLNETIKAVNKNMNNFELHLAIEQIYNFVWHDLADIYVEKSKQRRDDAQPVLELVFKQSLILLHPFMPFITEELYKKDVVSKESIMVETWPSEYKNI